MTVFEVIFLCLTGLFLFLSGYIIGRLDEAEEYKKKRNQMINKDVLKQIRAEIEQSKVNTKEVTMYEFHNDSPARFYNKGLVKAIRIIDKYISCIM